MTFSNLIMGIDFKHPGVNHIPGYRTLFVSLKCDLAAVAAAVKQYSSNSHIGPV